VEFDAVAYLASKGIRGRAASGGREMVYPCFFDCEEPPNSSKRKLYLQSSEGFYHCKVCGTSGGSYMLQKHFGDEPRSGSSDDGFARRRILDSAVKVGQTMLNSNDDVLLYLLNDRGLTSQTIIDRQLGFVAGGWSLVGSLPEGVTDAQVRDSGLVHRDGTRAGKDFFYKHVLIPYVSRGHVVQIRGRAWGEVRGGRYFTGPGETPRIFNLDSLDGAEEVIITEGEFDAMLLYQALQDSGDQRARKIAVIALPGLNAVPEEFDAVLSEAKRIYLGLDADDPGTKAAETFKERIGPRARILQLPAHDPRKCDWTEYLLPERPERSWRLEHPYAGHGWRDVLRLMATASGKRVFSVAEAGEAYRSYREQNNGLTTGYQGLDSTILPGLLPGQVVIVLAKTGSGKTLFLCNLAYNMRAERVLFVSLEMTREEVYDRLRRIYLFHHPLATDYEIDQGLANVFICDENRLGSKDLNVLANEFALEADGHPTVVFVDYLGYYARGFPGSSPYEKVGNAVMELKAEAKQGRFVVVSPAQVNRGAKEGKPIDLDDARDAGTVEETADFLLALFRPDDALQADGVLNTQQSGKVKLSLLKSRHGGKGRVFGLQMDLLTLAVVDDNTPEAKRASDHNHLAWRGHDWDYLRRKETAPRQSAFEGLPR
jgi:hypothetical protein